MEDQINTPFILGLMRRAVMNGKSDLAKTIFDILFPKGVEYFATDSSTQKLQCLDPTNDRNFQKALEGECDITCIKTRLAYLSEALYKEVEGRLENEGITV